MDSFSSHADQVSAPATRALPVIPDDEDVLPALPKALYVGRGGTIVMRGPRDEADRVWANVADGAILPFRAARVLATGTSAGDILALY